VTTNAPVKGIFSSDLTEVIESKAVSRTLSGYGYVNCQKETLTLPEGLEGCLVVVEPKVSTT